LGVTLQPTVWCRWVLEKEGDRSATSNARNSATGADAAPQGDAAAQPTTGAWLLTPSSSGQLALAGNDYVSGMVPGAGVGVGEVLQAILPPAGSSGGGANAAVLERLRAALRAKSGELLALEARVEELERTRDSLAEELLRVTQTAEQVGV